MIIPLYYESDNSRIEDNQICCVTKRSILSTKTCCHLADTSSMTRIDNVPIVIDMRSTKPPSHTSPNVKYVNFPSALSKFQTRPASSLQNTFCATFSINSGFSIDCMTDEEPEVEQQPPTYRVKPQTPRGVIDYLTEKEYRAVFEAKCRDIGTLFVDKLFQRFMKHQRKKVFEKTLDMSHCTLGPLAAKQVAQIVTEHPNFRILNLTGNVIKDQGALYIAELIENNSTIISLDVSSNAIGDAGAANIFKALRNNRIVTHLDISSTSGVSRNNFGATAIGEMGLMLASNKVLSELNIAMTEISCDDMGPLGTGLLANRTLNVLNLSNNNVRSKGAILVMASVAESPSIRELRFCNNHLKDDIAPHFESFFAKNRTLEILDLSGNSLTRKFCASLTAPFKAGCSLLELNLSRNPLGSRGIAALGLPLRKNKRLEALNVSACQIESAGFVEFCSHLLRNKSLVKLCISNNPILDEGGAALGEVIETHPKLQVLEMELVEVGDPTGAVIFNAIMKTKRMRKLNVKNNLVRDGILVQKTIVANPNLITCNVELNDIDYKVGLEIQRALAENRRKWKERQSSCTENDNSELSKANDQLDEVRKCIFEERQMIHLLNEKIAMTKAELKRMEQAKHEKLTGLEQRLEELTQEALQLLCENQAKTDEKRGEVLHQEAEVNAASNKLARETDRYGSECKALAILEAKITSSKTDGATELRNLNEQMKVARQKYEDCKQMLIDNYHLAREREEQRKAEEEAAKAAAEAPAPAGKKSPSRRKKTSRSRKSKSKSRVAADAVPSPK